MTVSSTTTRNSYSGNGSTTTFAYGFKIFADADLTVILRASTGVETVQSLTTHYTVTNAGNASGGNVVFGTAPASGVTVVIRRNMAITQATDYVANDPFPAATHEDALDRLTFISQQMQEEIDRSIKLSRTNTMTSTEFTTSATDRASKVLSFNASGELAVTQELGTFKGDSATTTTAAFTVRDIVKATTTAQLNNIYICVADSVIGDTLTDTDHFALLVDAVSAATSATTATTKATAAASSATAAASSASTASTQASNASTSASTASTQATNAANSATAAASSATSAATALDNFDDIFLGAKSSDPSVDNDGDSLTAGDLYFNTSSNVLKVYTGSTWSTVSTFTTGISNTNIPVFTSGVADDDFLRVAGTSIEGRSASEVLSDIGGQAALTFGISNTNIPIFTSGVADDDFLRVNGTSIEGRSASEVLSDIGASAVAGSSSIVTTGALNSGSITSGFGSIDTGSSTITTTGAITGGSLAVDNITIDGTEIDLSSGDLTLDIASDLNIDVDDGRIFLKDGGTTFGRLANSSTDFEIVSVAQDKDILFKGNDNGSEITALTLDMSDAGTATFNSEVRFTQATINSQVSIYTDGSGAEIDNTSGNFTIDTPGDIILDADGGDVKLKDGGTEFANLSIDNSGLTIVTTASDADFKINGNDGGSSITALTLDMSDAGTATFNHDVIVADGGFYKFGDGDTRIFGDTSNDLMAFVTNNSERVRINSSGTTLFGCTADPSSSVSGFSFSPSITSVNAHLSSAGSSTSSVAHINFLNGNGPVGNIVTSGGGTSFGTSSDYRLKENVNYNFDATTRLKQLKPSRFNFKTDADTTVDGFLAHEVASIVPEAITGTKDETRDVGIVKDADGKILYENVVESAKADGQTWTKTATENVYQSIDQSKLVPLLTKALQEQQATIEALTARITALEGA